MESSPEARSIAVGELLWDLLPSGPRLGGATTNFAVLSARLGEYSSLVSCVGEDQFGREALARLSGLALDEEGRAHLDLSGIQSSASLPTGTVSVTLDSEGRPRYVIDEPVAWDAIALVPGLVERAGSARVIYFGTLGQREELSRNSMRALIEAAGPECTRMCDLNLRMPFCTEEILRWSIAHADILKVSDEELSTVGHMLGNGLIAKGLEDAADRDALTGLAEGCAAELLRIATPCKLVAITLGPHGSLLMDRQGSFRHTGYAVDVVDTIGAGDAFTAGLVHAYLRGASLTGMSDVSNRCGSHVASQAGATPELPEGLRQEIRQILAGGGAA